MFWNFLFVLQSLTTLLHAYKQWQLSNILLDKKNNVKCFHSLKVKPMKMQQFESFSLGAPSSRPKSSSYRTISGVNIIHNVLPVPDPTAEVKALTHDLDKYHGVLLTSSYEYPGRYTRWTVGFTAPAIILTGRDNEFFIEALNQRGEIILQILEPRIRSVKELKIQENSSKKMRGTIIATDQYFPEEERSRQPSLFTLIRSVIDIFYHESAGQLGLYGALGYDLAFQFEKVSLNKKRSHDQRDFVLYLPDNILVLDNLKKDAWRVTYDFSTDDGLSTIGLPRSAQLARSSSAEVHANRDPPTRESLPGEYAKAVTNAKEQFRVGNLFEVVLSQVFREKVTVAPSTVFQRLCRRNPSPYGFFMNLGDGEHLVGASPEMFVRVERASRGLRVETCPISGTIERGKDPLEDALQIQKLLTNAKEESELTMCTDVDRNDKSRICVPGSVKVLGRRQIELYSRVIHTVDHVEGYLRQGFDALDAFLCHTWAVTVTGAPKTWAMRFIEQQEPSGRRWYGGAVGMLACDGSLNTGLTLRTIRIKDGIAEVRAGATLLHDSDPQAEERETELKASAMIDAVIRDDAAEEAMKPLGAQDAIHSDCRVLLVDHEDSFVHTLANYLRQSGAEVITCRSGAAMEQFVKTNVDTGVFVPTIAVLSPGPGSPSDFKLSKTISMMTERNISIFGVCLGLQGIVEHFGGKLNVLGYPMHGKSSIVTRTVEDGDVSADILQGLPKQFQVARYHSLHADKDTFPEELQVTALTDDGVIMAIQHKTLPIAAVQFHPESILTLPATGMKIITNAIDLLKASSTLK